MLDIDIENKKGILFVRLYGELSKNTISKWNYDVKDLIVDNGIKNVVFNISNLMKIDEKGINSLLYSYELCKNNHGQSIICGVNDNIRKPIIRSRLLKYMIELDNENSAFSLINV